MCILFSTLRDFFPLMLHLGSGDCHKLGIKGPLKRLLLNELDSKAKAWRYGWTCKSIFHIITQWLVEKGDRVARCGLYYHWFRLQNKSSWSRQGLAVACFSEYIVEVIKRPWPSGSFPNWIHILSFCSAADQPAIYSKVNRSLFITLKKTSALCLST